MAVIADPFGSIDRVADKEREGADEVSVDLALIVGIKRVDHSVGELAVFAACDFVCGDEIFFGNVEVLYEIVYIKRL